MSDQTEIPEAGRDPQMAARVAGLTYVNDEEPGIRRKRSGRGFRYLDARGETVRDRETLARIKALAIPPAWTDVWISADPNGHIQASGRDARGRKQYRYHAKWSEVRDEAKYYRTIAFAKALPRLRQRLSEDLARPGLPREKVVATVVRLLETTFMRVGNEEYARENKSFGLTTLRNRHVAFAGSEVRFRFKGKSGHQYEVAVRDRRLARILRQCQDLPGQHLFQYVDDEGVLRPIDSDDVNDYLRQATGEEFTAKDYRTWAGTYLAAMALQAYESFDSEAAAKKNVVRAIQSVASRLGNTPAVCRRSYIHPAILESYHEGKSIEGLKQHTEGELSTSVGDFSAEEAAVLALLQQRLEQAEAHTDHAA